MSGSRQSLEGAGVPACSNRDQCPGKRGRMDSGRERRRAFPATNSSPTRQALSKVEVTEASDPSQGAVRC